MNARGEQTQSLWMNVEVYPRAPKFSGKTSCDTVIIGSGIAGCRSPTNSPTSDRR